MHVAEEAPEPLQRRQYGVPAWTSSWRMRSHSDASPRRRSPAASTRCCDRGSGACRRDNEAARVGWQTLRFPWEEVVHDPDDVAATVRDVRAQRLSSVQRSVSDR